MRTLRLRIGLLSLAACSALLPAGRASACSCACYPLPPIQWSVATSDAVFQGLVVNIVQVTVPGPIPEVFAVEFDLSAVWKGPVAQTLTVYTPISDFSCGIAFTIGVEYTVYATLQGAADGNLSAMLCSRTHELRPEEAGLLGPPCFEGRELVEHEGETCPGTVPPLPPDTFPPCFLFLRGDADTSGAVDLTDAVATLNKLFRGQNQVHCDDAADANDDGDIDIADPVATLNSLFLGAGPLPPPGPEYCELDPTDDLLTCAGSTVCPFEE